MSSNPTSHPSVPIPTAGPEARELPEARETAFPGAQPRQEVPAAVESPDPALPRASNLTLLEVERRHILRVMEAVGFQVDAAAPLLGIPRSTLYVKLKSHGIGTSRIQKWSLDSRF